MRGKKRQKPKSPPHRHDAAELKEANAYLRTLPIPALIVTINTMLTALQERGFEIRDWDMKHRVFERMTFNGGKVYALIVADGHAESPTAEKEVEHGGER